MAVREKNLRRGGARGGYRGGPGALGVLASGERLTTA